MLASSFRGPWRLAGLVLCVTALHLWLLDAPWRPQGLGAMPVAEPARMTLVAPRIPTPAPAPVALPALAAEPAPAEALTDVPPQPAGPLAGAEPRSAPPPAPTPATSPPSPLTAEPSPAAPVATPDLPAVQLPPQVSPAAPPSGQVMAIAPEASASGTLSTSAAVPGSAGALAAASAPAQAAASAPAWAAESPPEGAPLAMPATLLRAESAEWLYRAERGAGVGEAVLRWRVASTGYELGLQASVAGRSVVDWLSRGSLSEQGLQPQRMVERQREREVQAVNFQRDKGLISFSGPSRTAPLLPGAQDRLSWVIQLAAISRARGGLQPGEVLRLQVAGPRGDVDEWRFTVQPVDERLLNGRRVGLTHLLREPQRPYDLRVQLWLAPTMDHLPVGIAWGVEPAGQPLILWMTSLPILL